MRPSTLTLLLLPVASFALHTVPVYPGGDYGILGAARLADSSWVVEDDQNALQWSLDKGQNWTNIPTPPSGNPILVAPGTTIYGSNSVFPADFRRCEFEFDGVANNIRGTLTYFEGFSAPSVVLEAR